MKLRNKKTREIKEWSFAMLQNIAQTTERKHYASLAELNEDWEDYEKPKRGWFINNLGKVCEDYCLSEDMQEAQRSIGNYFETKEEAEQAAEKLKAWKRLRDKGFKFRGWCDRGAEPIGDMGFHMPKTGEEWTEDEIADLESLFGGEE